MSLETVVHVAFALLVCIPLAVLIAAGILRDW